MARKKTSRKSYTRSNSKKSKTRTKKVVKRKKSTKRQTKRGGMQGSWNYDGMSPQGFQQPQESAVPAGPLTECQTLECKKRRAEEALEQMKAELEAITVQLQDARALEQMNSLLIPLDKAYSEISSMVTSSTSSIAGDVRRRSGQLAENVGRRSGQLGKIASKQISKRIITPVAKKAKGRFAPGTPGYLALKQLEESSERFGRY